MTDGKDVKAGEHGLVRVFVLSNPADQPVGKDLPLGQIAEALGVTALDAADVQQIWTGDMAEMSLEELLANGYGISADELAQNKANLDAAMGLHPTVFVLIRSSAFMGKAVTLADDGPLALIATLREPGVDVSFDPLPNPEPEAVIEDAPQKKKPSDAAMSGRIATIALLVMALLVWLMIWIAG